MTVVTDCSGSSFVNGTVDRPARPGDRCSAEEHTCSSCPSSHLITDCMSATAVVCSTLQRDALPSSSCQVIHYFWFECSLDTTIICGIAHVALVVCIVVIFFRHFCLSTQYKITFQCSSTGICEQDCSVMYVLFLKVKGRHLNTTTYMNMTSSGLQCKVAYWPAITLDGAAQVAAAHCPNERTLDPRPT